MLNKEKGELGVEPLPCNGEMKPRHLVLSKAGKEKKGMMFSLLKCSLMSPALCRTAQQPLWAADQDSSQAGNTSAMPVRLESPFCAKSNTEAFPGLSQWIIPPAASFPFSAKCSYLHWEPASAYREALTFYRACIKHANQYLH